MSLNKLVPGFGSASLDFAPALANLNFDFTLYKLEAPKEFEGVGSTLSRFRREKAEGGIPHITARKLGALFQSLVPPIPRLIGAYGQRSSEISQSSAISDEGRESFGVFASQAGIDATSVWAAATSGGEAIAIHLLACILARMWDGPEATSIWVEIVKARKKEINEEFDQSNITYMTALYAAKQEMTRTQIAEWDASARAWLRAADVVKNKQQKQLILIVDNLQMPVNRKTSTYHSVIDAWRNSMIQLEGLIKGISQSAHNGDILLALSAWHLFPDLSVATSSIVSVHQHDAIFSSGGVLTIGLDRPTLLQQAPNGIYWSLPLAHLRHYGTPVISVQSIGSSSRSRLSLTELLQATLGCVLSGWGKCGNDTRRAITLLANISSMISEEADAGSKDAQLIKEADNQTSWLSLLFAAAQYHISITGVDLQTANKLLSLGRRHGRDFLGLPKEPMLGLLEHGSFVGLLADDNKKIDVLRKIARPIADRFRLSSDDIFIRYKHSCPGVRNPYYEYATAIPSITRSRKRKSDSESSEETIHCRWLYTGSELWKGDARAFQEAALTESDLTGGFGLLGFSQDELELINKDYLLRSETYGHFRQNSFVPMKKDEMIQRKEDESIIDNVSGGFGTYWDRHKTVSGSNCYRFIYGDEDECALFATQDELYSAKPRPVDIDTGPAFSTFPQEIYSLSESNCLDKKKVVERIMKYLQFANPQKDSFIKSLKALSTAASLYKNFQDASVDVRVLTRPLSSSRWIERALDLISSYDPRAPLDRPPDALLPYILDQAEAFACITMFEQGIYDLEPLALENVMAISSGSSLFVSAALLVDPAEDAPLGDIRHVPGNVGRPGITFLVPPKNPMIKEVTLSEWPLIQRNDFDGHLCDCFGSTSLHLSFTGADTPFNLGFSGGQDSEAWMVETLISVHDGRRWIADLDILKTITSDQLNKIPYCDHHDTNPEETKILKTCIDSWHALLDRPEDQTYLLDPQLSLVRAHKNWQARLAAASVSVALGFETIIVPSEVCWKCFNDVILVAAKKNRNLVAIS